MARQEANWVEINPATLGDDISGAYDTYKALYRQMKEARVAFESSMAAAAELPSGKRMVFGYNFGKLSVAIVDDDRPAPKAKSSTVSLADFLRAQQASGRAA